MAWGSSQSLQHKQKIFEAKFWWAVGGGQGMGAIGNSAWWGSYWVSLSQDRIVFPARKTHVLLGRLPSLRMTFPILYKIFSPMERSWNFTLPALPVGGAWLNQLVLTWSPVPGFLNKHKTVDEICWSFTCVRTLVESPDHKIPLTATHKHALPHF